MNHVWQHSKQKGGSLLVLLAIADFADDQGNAYPGMDKLATKSRLTDRQTQRVVRKLEKAHELKVQEGKGPHGCHLYTVPMTPKK